MLALHHIAVFDLAGDALPYKNKRRVRPTHQFMMSRVAG